MKKYNLILITITLLFSGIVRSQVSVNVNIGSPPLWGPVGYTDVRYYYLPDVEAYYDVHTSMFIYFGGGIWLHKPQLPGMYSSYDLYGGYKVVMTGYRGNSPQIHFKDHKRKYTKGYKNGSQKTIGQKPGKQNSGAPKHKSGSGKSQGGHSEKQSVPKNNKSNGGLKSNNNNSSPKQSAPKQSGHKGGGNKK